MHYFVTRRTYDATQHQFTENFAAKSRYVGVSAGPSGPFTRYQYNAADWAKISKGIKTILDKKIEDLTRTRDVLDGCIGCGCLSLKKCALYNPGDKAGKQGAGPRFVLGDRGED